MTQARTRRRATRPAGPPNTPGTATCRCTTGPVTVAVFRNQHLVEVQRRHLYSEHCGLGTEHVDVDQWRNTR